MKIKQIELFDYKTLERQIIYAPTETKCMCEQRDRDIMKAVTNGGKFYKFTAKGIKGAETIKNDENLWYDMDNNIYQICCGRVTDMTGKNIPNTFYVRLIGWCDYEEE